MELARLVAATPAACLATWRALARTPPVDQVQFQEAWVSWAVWALWAAWVVDSVPPEVPSAVDLFLAVASLVHPVRLLATSAEGKQLVSRTRIWLINARPNHFARDCQAQAMKCYACGKLGHISRDCTAPNGGPLNTAGKTCYQ